MQEYKKRGRPIKGQPKAITMNISMSIETREKLERISKETGDSMAEIIRQALDRLEK